VTRCQLSIKKQKTFLFSKLDYSSAAAGPSTLDLILATCPMFIVNVVGVDHIMSIFLIYTSYLLYDRTTERHFIRMCLPSKLQFSASLTLSSAPIFHCQKTTSDPASLFSLGTCPSHGPYMDAIHWDSSAKPTCRSLFGDRGGCSCIVLITCAKEGEKINYILFPVC